MMGGNVLVMSAQPKVFVSHAHEDKERFVTHFAERLRSRGIDAWVDEWKIGPDDSILDKIFEEGLKNAQAMIIVLSSHSVVKPWVREELNAGLIRRIEHKTKIIPVVIDDCEIPEALKNTLHVRIRDLSHYDAELDRVVSAIFGISEKPELGPVPEYARGVRRIFPDLNDIDNAVLNLACKELLRKDSDLLTADMISGAANSLGITNSQLVESIEVLGAHNIFKISSRIGAGHGPFRIMDYGLEQYARIHVPNYDQVVRDVALQVLNQGKNNSGDIAGALQLPPQLVNHILRAFGEQGFCKVSRQVGTLVVIFDVSALMRRAFE
jgi:hypothetical protein